MCLGCSCSCNLLLDMAQEAITGVFHQVQYLIEPLTKSVVLIGHHRSVICQTKLREPPHLAEVFGWVVPLHQTQIAPVYK